MSALFPPLPGGGAGASGCGGSIPSAQPVEHAALGLWRAAHGSDGSRALVCGWRGHLHHIHPKPLLFEPVARPCPSFSGWWKQTRIAPNRHQKTPQ